MKLQYNKRRNAYEEEIILDDGFSDGNDDHHMSLSVFHREGADSCAGKEYTDNLQKTVKEYQSGYEKLGSSYSRRRQQYYDFEDRLEAVDRKIDRLDDMWESDYRAGRVTRNAYHNVEYKIESVENYMDTVENYLERKFNYEFDD